MFAVLRFPGSNDDRDLQVALRDALGAQAQLVWHRAPRLPPETRGVLLPGGFSYGDYLRAGAMARFSPVMADTRRFADAGGPVLGICNGFQILCEAGLLPGALLRNRELEFVCAWITLRVERAAAPFTARATPGQLLRLPIKHGQGRYVAPPECAAELAARGQILLRYCDPSGRVSEAANPNGSLDQIAGVVNRRGNVLGLMPHPEHAVSALCGGEDGRVLLGSLCDAVGLGAGAGTGAGAGAGALTGAAG